MFDSVCDLDYHPKLWSCEDPEMRTELRVWTCLTCERRSHVQVQKAFENALTKQKMGWNELAARFIHKQFIAIWYWCSSTT